MEIKDRINGISIDHRAIIISVRKHTTLKNKTKIPSKLTMKEIFLVKAALIISFMASEMIAIPIAKQNKGIIPLTHV